MTGMVDAPTLALADRPLTDRQVIGFLIGALAAIPSCLSITDGVLRMAGHMPTLFTEVSLRRGVESATAEGSEAIRRRESHLTQLRISEETVGRRCRALQ